MEERQVAVEVIFRIREEGPKEWGTSSGIRPFKVVTRAFLFISSFLISAC